MAKISTTTIEHSASRQLKALLALAREPGGRTGFLPEGLGGRADLARHLSRLCEGAAPSGEALLSALCTRETPLAALEGIKELAKSMAGKAGSDIERAAANLLYHAAVAAALGRHRQNISSRPAMARADLYEDLAAWLSGDALGQVFQQAADALAAELGSGKPAL